MAVTVVLFIDLPGHTLEEKSTVFSCILLFYRRNRLDYSHVIQFLIEYRYPKPIHVLRVPLEVSVRINDTKYIYLLHKMFGKELLTYF